jgi:predicted short-subunit dehydrogenase-like oxidoreductase (DUF2520 family)
MQQKAVTIIGLGNLGKAFLKGFSTCDVPVHSVFSRDTKKVKQLAGRYEIEIFGSFPEDIDQLGDLIFLTVSDSAIKETADRLSSLEEDFNGRIIAHCSGNESDQLLDSLRQKGALTASFHPLQTFTGSGSSEVFKDIYFSLQGDPQVFPHLKNLASLLNSKTLEVDARQKSYLHTAAVMASNYLIALLDAANDIGSEGGFSSQEAQKALLPLVKTTLQNAEGISLDDALTGPIKRGDIQTVQKHLNLLKDTPELYNLYCCLGVRCIDLAESSGSLDTHTVDQLRRLLKV